MSRYIHKFRRLLSLESEMRRTEKIIVFDDILGYGIPFVIMHTYYTCCLAPTLVVHHEPNQRIESIVNSRNPVNIVYKQKDTTSKTSAQ